MLTCSHKLGWQFATCLCNTCFVDSPFWECLGAMILRERKKAHKHKLFALVNVRMALGQMAGCPRVNRAKKFMCSLRNTGNINFSLWLTAGCPRFVPTFKKFMCSKFMCLFLALDTTTALGFLERDIEGFCTKCFSEAFLDHWEIKGRFRKRVVLANVPSFRFSFLGNIRRNHPFGNHPFGNHQKGSLGDKRAVSKRVVLANVPSFRFSFRGNIRRNHPFGNHPFANPRLEGVRQGFRSGQGSLRSALGVEMVRIRSLERALKPETRPSAEHDTLCMQSLVCIRLYSGKKKHLNLNVWFASSYHWIFKLRPLFFCFRINFDYNNLHLYFSNFVLHAWNSPELFLRVQLFFSHRVGYWALLAHVVSVRPQEFINIHLYLGFLGINFFGGIHFLTLTLTPQNLGNVEGSRTPWVIKFHGRLGCWFVTL